MMLQDPNFSIKLLKHISKNLKNNKAVVPIVSRKETPLSTRLIIKYLMLIEKKSLLTQTPQAFSDFKIYLILLFTKK